LVAAFTDGQKLLEAAEKPKLEGVVSKRLMRPIAPVNVGWRKVKTEAWRAANRERWKLFERA